MFLHWVLSNISKGIMSTPDGGCCENDKNVHTYLRAMNEQKAEPQGISQFLFTREMEERDMGHCLG